MTVNRSVPHIDALIVNLIAPDPRIILEQDTTVELWQIMFDTIVHPLYRLVDAALPQMRARRAGKVVVMGSANARRGTSGREGCGDPCRLRPRELCAKSHIEPLR
jgi:NADP-dependent 3-hydroxy acid dehydrogenase YdfG